MATSPTSEHQQLDPLTCVAVVLRSCSAELEALPHVVSLISSFLDFATPTRWSIERACERGLGLRMLRRLAAHEASEGLAMDPFYRAYLASKGLVSAIRRSSGDDGDDGDDGDEGDDDDGDDVEIVRWMCCEYCPRVVPVKAMVEAAKCGRLRILQYLFERYPNVQPSDEMVEDAAGSGALNVLQFLLPRAKETYLSVHAVDFLLSLAAVYHDEVEIVQWLLHERRNLVGDMILVNGPVLLASAIENGRFKVAKLLVEQGYQLGSSMQVKYVRKCGDLETVKWLHAYQLTSSKVRWIDLAAEAGDLSVIKWVHENIPESVCSTNAMDCAARYGHFEIMKWLHANRTERCTTDAMDFAAQNGHLEVVEWLHANRREGCTADAMDYAAEYGHLEIVKWLHKHRTEGCTSWSMDQAARNGHLDVVQWLHANRPEGCTVGAMNFAARNGHLHVVKWLHENRTEGCTTDAMDHAGSVEVLQWLHEHRSEGCTDNAMVNAAQKGDFEVLLYLKEHQLDVGVDGRVMTKTIRIDGFEIFEWLHVTYPEHFASKATARQWIEGSRGTGMWAMYFQFESSLADL